jgi:hypothetical protein
MGTDSSPPDKYANRAFTKIAKNDIVAIEVCFENNFECKYQPK